MIFHYICKGSLTAVQYDKNIHKPVGGIKFINN